MKKILLLMTIFVSTNLFADQIGSYTGTPSYLKLKVYKVGISENADCTELTTIMDIDESSASYVDILDSPTIGSGSVASGTYPCVVIEFSSVIKYAVDTNSTNSICQANVENELNVCQSGSSSTLIDGTTTTCTSGDDRVALYLTTLAGSDGSGQHSQDAFNAPSDSSDTTKGFTLSSALEISGKTTGVFVVNGSDKVLEYDSSNSTVGGGDDYCEMSPPLFSFSKQ